MPTAPLPTSDAFPVIIITGLSGSGKSTALDVFEDMGFFAVDGLPAVLASQMVQMVTEAAMSQYSGVVLGVDIRQSVFVKEYEKAIIELRNSGYLPRVIFFEATPDILLKRYAATRRPHPLEREGLGLEQALAMERERLDKLRKTADLVIDTSVYSIHDLRRTIQSKWHALQDKHHKLRIHLITFGFKYGTPAEADMVFDLRFLPNPYFIPELRPLSGQDTAVAEYVLNKDPGKSFTSRLLDFLLYTLDLNEKEGRFRLTVAIGCTGGRHRSVAVAEAIAEALESSGYSFSLEHRHLNLG